MFNRKNAAKYLMPYLYKIIVHRINIKLKNHTEIILFIQ